MDIAQTLCREFQLKPQQCDNVLRLIDEGNTIPFIARYRKEQTGSLDDQVLRELHERLQYLRGLVKRREEIASALSEQGNLTDELSAKLERAATLTELEDLYRPFRPKRRTRATVARERGLEPLALALLLQNQNRGSAEALAAPFICPEKGVETAQDALQGARDILAEQMSDDADVRKALRALALRTGVLESKNATDADSVYAMYYDFSQEVRAIPAHRVLAVNRGEREGLLKVALRLDDAACVDVLNGAFVRPGSVSTEQVRLAAQDAWERLLQPSVEREIRAELTERASASAIRVFGKNLHQLLMSPPVKGRVTLGVDPGFRTGCKLAVVDESGKVLETGVGHFTLPGQEAAKARARREIVQMCRRHGVTAIAIGNGTASREAEQFIASLLGELPEGAAYMIVSEAGASVYSASKLAAEEFPQFDVSLRSAVSIARRMQDPLAELVKIDPKAIGVGQYQHDLKESQLEEALDGVVEGCVNSVGVEVSTASAQLLSHVAGIGPALARNIVAFRHENGPFQTRRDLLKVPRLGPKAFEQCSGFLRIRGGRQPLDASAVHPESYAVVECMAKDAGTSVSELMRSPERRRAVDISRYVTDTLGLPTLTDIMKELEKPGRDPRGPFKPFAFAEGVHALEDLRPGMKLPGIVTNITAFGAFVDIGVHQDGLVHISQLAYRFVRDPNEVVRVHQEVAVTVLDVDIPRKRISLSMRNQ